MTHSKLFSAAVAVGALLASTGASALVVTLNPQADNGLGAAGVLSATNAAFQAVGFQSNLTSTLVINGNSGNKTYSETGLIDITSFQDALNNTVSSGVFSNYRLKGAFTGRKHIHRERCHHQLHTEFVRCVGCQHHSAGNGDPEPCQPAGRICGRLRFGGKWRIGLGTDFVERWPELHACSGH